jgi:dTDP-4-dehydrorhamnose 3,5-epimerase
MKVETTPFKDAFIIHDTVFEDQRGYFFESFNKKEFIKQTGLDVEFVQDNQSYSSKKVLRGLHLQTGESAQAKLVRVLEGSVYDVIVDLRTGSDTFGQTYGIELTSKNRLQLFIPRGFAHGFVVTSEVCTFFYKCDNYYNKSSEIGIFFNDPDMNITWPFPLEELIISEKDRNNFSFKEAIKKIL